MKRRVIKSTVSPAKGSNPVYHELGLLPSRSLMALKYYLDYAETKHALEMLEALFRNYKKHKAEVQKALIDAIKFLVIDRYKKDVQQGGRAPEYQRPSKQKIEFLKREINQIAKRVWSKK